MRFPGAQVFLLDRLNGPQGVDADVRLSSMRGRGRVGERHAHHVAVALHLPPCSPQPSIIGHTNARCQETRVQGRSRGTPPVSPLLDRSRDSRLAAVPARGPLPSEGHHPLPADSPAAASLRHHWSRGRGSPATEPLARPRWLLDRSRYCTRRSGRCVPSQEGGRPPAVGGRQSRGWVLTNGVQGCGRSRPPPGHKKGPRSSQHRVWPQAGCI